jgi:WD40 repeat protein
LAISPDGKTMAVGHGMLSRPGRPHVVLWDLATGKPRATLKGHGERVNSVAFTPDGRTLASGSSDQTIKLWDVATGNELTTLRGHTGGVNAVVFLADGKHLASGSSDTTIKVWDVAAGNPAK